MSAAGPADTEQITHTSQQVPREERTMSNEKIEQIQTGELRSLLQPVIYVRLNENVGGLEAGDVVGAQYWGNGKVTLTRVPDGKRAVGVAHSIKAETIIIDNSISNGPTLSLRYIP